MASAEIELATLGGAIVDLVVGTVLACGSGWGQL